ncbi:MAG: branched-chain amino acid ABC transporter permease [Ilumatobacteraceae bacterium]
MTGHQVTAVRASRAALLVMMMAIGVGALLSASPTSAQEPPPLQSIGGRVQNRFVEEGERVTEPVVGVRIIVLDEAGTEVASAETDDEGRYLVAIETPGTYTVRIDESSLPDDLTVEEGGGEQEAVVAGNQRVTRAFFLGTDTRDIRGKWSLLPQTLANGVKLAMIIAITSVGLSLIYGTTGLSNFAHGEMVTFGALIAFYFNREVGLNMLLAAPLAVIATAAAGSAQELGLWRRLRHSGTSLTSMMIVSIGFALAVRYVFLFVYGAGQDAYSDFTLQTDPISLGSIDLAPRSVWIIVLSTLVIVGVALFLLRARFGKAIRAVSDNPELASSTGIDTDRVVLVVWTLGGALAGIGGVFYGLEYGVKWDMGFTLLLLMFAAITLGGLGNPFGALAGSLVVGIFVELWTWVVPNANDLKTVGALFALILILLIRPQGLLGRKERVG